MNVYFIRHGYALHNQLAEIMGDAAYFDIQTIDSPLLEKGINQAKLAGNEINNINFDYICCSPAWRCIETLENLFENTELNKYTYLFDDLMEPQGEHICNKRKNFQELFDYCLKQKNIYNLTNINKYYNFDKEIHQNFIERTNNFYKYLQILKLNKNKNILVVGHYDWINSFFKYNFNIDYYPKNCEIKKIIL